MLNKWRSLQQRSQGPIFRCPRSHCFSLAVILSIGCIQFMATVGGPILPFTSTRGAARAAVFTSDSRSSGSRTASHSLLHTYFQHKYWQKLSYPHLLIVWTIVHSNVPFQKHISVNLHFSKLQWTFTMKGNKLPSSALVDVTQNNIIWFQF